MPWWLLIERLAEGGEITTEPLLTMSKQTVQEDLVCRKEGAARAQDFQRVQGLADLGLRASAMGHILLAALKDCEDNRDRDRACMS